MTSLALRRSPLDNFRFYYEEVLAKKKHGRYVMTKPSYDFKKSFAYRYVAYLVEVITK